MSASLAFYALTHPDATLTALSRLGWQDGVAFSLAGPRHREYRKLLSTSLNTAAARRLAPLQHAATVQLLRAPRASTPAAPTR